MRIGIRELLEKHRRDPGLSIERVGDVSLTSTQPEAAS